MRDIWGLVYPHWSTIKQRQLYRPQPELSLRNDDFLFSHGAKTPKSAITVRLSITAGHVDLFLLN
jgi:hypothetical protein